MKERAVMDYQALLETSLKLLHLPTFLQNYQAYAQDAARAGQSCERYLLALCEAEIKEREVQRIERAIAQARFPVLKDFSSFDFALVQGISQPRVLELAQGGYLTRAETIILIGNPGLGKTHIATGLALAACKQGKRVRFYGAANLVNELLAAQKDLRLSRFTAQFLKLDLLVLDELGFIPFSKDGAQLLFQLCSDLYERVSIIVTTNLRFADWNSIFADERMTAALLDRLTHRAHMLEFIGESYRFRQRLRQEEPEGREAAISQVG
jgi:DNA replication protein DnaC